MSLTSVSNIFIMTLKLTPNRKWGCIGALEAREFPMDRVHAVHGIDGLEYKTHQAIIKDAVADGFPFFENPDFLKRPIPMVAGSWSACRVLRCVAKTQETAIIMEDDWVFGIDYPEIEKRLKKLERARASDDSDEPTLIAALISKLHSRGKFRRSVKAIDQYWIEGVPASAACANVFTPAGAELALKLFNEYKATTLEKITMGIEYPTAATLLEPIGRHPLLMGPSRANPEGTRRGFVDAYEKWEKGYQL